MQESEARGAAGDQQGRDDEPPAAEAEGERERRGKEEEQPDGERPGLAAGLEGEHERDDEGEPAGTVGRGCWALGGPAAQASDRRQRCHVSASSSGPFANARRITIAPAVDGHPSAFPIPDDRDAHQSTDYSHALHGR